LANFVGIVVGFFNVLLQGVHPQRGHNKKQFISLPVSYAMMAWLTYVSVALSFESEMVSIALTGQHV